MIEYQVWGKDERSGTQVGRTFEVAGALALPQTNTLAPGGLGPLTAQGAGRATCKSQPQALPLGRLCAHRAAASCSVPWTRWRSHPKDQVRSDRNFGWWSLFFFLKLKFYLFLSNVYIGLKCQILPHGL